MEVLRSSGLEVVDFYPDTPQAVGEAARWAAHESSIDAIVSCGGDGMLSLVLQEQVGSGKPLGVIPSGTGNDHARYYGIPLHPCKAARVIAQGYWQETDLGLAVFDHGARQAPHRWFSTIACVGFDQLVNDKAQEISWPRGSLRYMLALLTILAQFRPYPVKVNVDGVDLPYRALSLIAIANTSSYGGGTKIAPQASVLDGRFAITALGPMTRRRAIRLLGGLKFGDISRDSRYIFASGQRVTLEMADLVPIADGEPLESGPLTLEIRPRTGLFLVSPNLFLASPDSLKQ